jgi:hypothetical protein
MKQSAPVCCSWCRIAVRLRSVQAVEHEREKIPISATETEVKGKFKGAVLVPSRNYRDSVLFSVNEDIADSTAAESRYECPVHYTAHVN